MTNLIQLAVGMLDLDTGQKWAQEEEGTTGVDARICVGELKNLAEESPFLLLIVSAFMLLIYSFFFNLLVSQFCGVYASLAQDSEGHARLSRGEVILDTLKALRMIQRTIQRTLGKYFKGKGTDSDFTLSSSHNSSSNKGD
eukprot:g1837.t1